MEFNVVCISNSNAVKPFSVFSHRTTTPSDRGRTGFGNRDAPCCFSPPYPLRGCITRAHDFPWFLFTRFTPGLCVFRIGRFLYVSTGPRVARGRTFLNVIKKKYQNDFVHALENSNRSKFRRARKNTSADRAGLYWPRYLENIRLINWVLVLLSSMSLFHLLTWRDGRHKNEYKRIKYISKLLWRRVLIIVQCNRWPGKESLIVRWTILFCGGLTIFFSFYFTIIFVV